MRNISDKIVEKIKTHILVSVNFFPKVAPFITRCGGATRAGGDNVVRRREEGKSAGTHTRNIRHSPLTAVRNIWQFD
jgi:hypothetical protein